MRHILSITVAFLYLLLSTGVQISAHYCHGELESVRILTESKSCCCGHSEMSGECCSNENISLQADIDQHLGAESRKAFVHFENLLVIANCLSSQTIESKEKNTNSPFLEISLPPPQPVWLLNCALTYYG
jgi:hypothetical protein